MQSDAKILANELAWSSPSLATSGRRLQTTRAIQKFSNTIVMLSPFRDDGHRGARVAGDVDW